MKLLVQLDGIDYELEQNGNNYVLSGPTSRSGAFTIAEVMPGVFSVLLGTRSVTVYTTSQSEILETSVEAQHHRISIGDPRDRSTRNKKANASGRVEVRAQMPGKVVKLLVEPGAQVQTGQGLIVVEAMKMQNEMKSPKDGSVSKIYAKEGSSVAANEPLLIIE